MKPVLEAYSEDQVRNPYIQWGEDLGKALDDRDFGAREKLLDLAPKDLRQVFVRCRNADMDAENAFEEIRMHTGYDVGEVEKVLVGELFQDTGMQIETLALVPADWNLDPDAASTNDTGEPDFLKEFEVLAVGPKIHAVPGNNPGEAFETGLGSQAKLTDRLPVIAGVIDDGIPFLNKRFFSGGRARIESLMIQTAAYFAEDPDIPERVLNTRILSAPQIDVLRDRANAEGETATYARTRKDDPLLSAGLRVGVNKTVEQAASHGGFILDLMAGSPPIARVPSVEREDCLRQVPILAAQLPPQSVDDTSGARLELPILAAMRWMIAKALLSGAEALVINLSFGVSAGSKDGRSFLETAFERLIQKTAPSLSVHLVLPFGNEFRARGVQVSKPADADGLMSLSAEVLLARADETPSFVEVCALDHVDLPAGLEVAVTSPLGERSDFKAVAEGGSLLVMLDSVVVGRIFHIPARAHFGKARQLARLLFAFAPTAEPRRVPPAPERVYPNTIGLARPGRWRLHIGMPQGARPRFAVQVQRDDSAFGYHNRGQQTVLDDARAHSYSNWFRDFTDLPADGPITRAGTNTAYVSRARTFDGAGGIYAVASARSYFRHANDPTAKAGASDYASERANWSAAQPPDSAIVVDVQAADPGVPGTGTVSGSAVRLTGSSAAAAIFSRNKILSLAGGSQSSMLPDHDPSRENRVGRHIVRLPEEFRRRP